MMLVVQGDTQTINVMIDEMKRNEPKSQMKG